LPEPGSIEQYLKAIDQSWCASFTFGLSSIDHPLWRFGKPELMICVNTLDDAWGLAVGFLAMQHRGDAAFAYGSTFELGHRVSAAPAMTAFLAFALKAKSNWSSTLGRSNS
jgi:hypothetical protein